MDRSRRATNPENYNEDGTGKKQGNPKVTWNKSNHYIKYQNEVRELYRPGHIVLYHVPGFGKGSPADRHGEPPYHSGGI